MTVEELREEANKQWDLVKRCIKSCRAVYLWGPPGLGKTFTACEILNQMNISARRIVLNEDFSVQEIMGMYIPRGGEFIWINGPVVEAMERGALVVDEMHRASGPVLDFFLGVLDCNSAGITLPTGVVVVPHSNFKVVATANVGPEVLDPALQDRFEVALNVTLPHPGVIDVLNTRVARLGDFVLGSYADEDEARIISPRKALTFAKLVCDFGWNELDAARAVFGMRAEEVLGALRISRV